MLHSRQYTSDLNMIHSYVPVPPWHQHLYPGIDDTDVKSLKPGGNSLLYVSVCCKSPASQVLLKVSKKMELAGCRIRTVGRMVYKLPAKEIHIFKKLLADRHFVTDADRKQPSAPGQTLDTDFFYIGIQALVPWWDKQMSKATSLGV